MKTNKNLKSEIKKNPKYKLENFNKLFVQMGLVLTLLIVFILFENKTECHSPKQNIDNSVAIYEDYQIDFTPIPDEEQLEDKPEDKVPEVEIDIIEKIDDDKEIQKTIIKTTKTEPTAAPQLPVAPIKKPRTKIKKEVPYAKVEKAPMYPGCENEKTELDKKKCLQTKISKHIGKHFNANLANELGLDSGKKRIMVQFKIDANGNITNILAKAPHPRLKKEAVRIINKLPKMIPGMQRNQPVIVKYALPIQFVVE